MNKMIILNHKMNLEYDQVYEYIDGLNKFETSNNIIICPSNIYLENFINNSTWGIGAQNVFEKIEGEYTGEISTLQLKSLGVEYCIVGHYERKRYFNETYEVINRKVISCLESNIIPIVCIGSSGIKDSVTEELDLILKDIQNIDFIVFAYEPLELDQIPDVERIEDDINFIYEYLYSKYESRPNVIYGGGVNKENIQSIMDLDNLNGVIIGKVSCDINQIKNIIENID